MLLQQAYNLQHNEIILLEIMYILLKNDKLFFAIFGQEMFCKFAVLAD